jgi:hypothetical protein
MTYSQAATAGYLGKAPEKFVSRETACELAKAAYERGRAYALSAGDASPVLGLGATATLSTDRPKKGACRYHIAVYGGEAFRPLAFSRSEGLERLDRKEQGWLSDLDALNLILEALGLERLDLFDPVAWPTVGWRPWQVIWPDGRLSRAEDLEPERTLLLPGSFNPLHEGHLKSALAAERQTGKHVIFLLEGGPHPEKGPIDDAEISRRLAQFAWKAPVMVTRGAPLYLEKATRMPGFGFVVGADTICRIFDPRFYPPAHEGAKSDLGMAIAQLEHAGTRFYVFDRIDGDRLRTLEDLPEMHLPAYWRKRLCTRLEGRWDVSSTELRAHRPR